LCGSARPHRCRGRLEPRPSVSIPGEFLVAHLPDVASERFQLLIRPEQVAELLQRLGAVLEPVFRLEQLVDLAAVLGSPLLLALGQLHRHPLPSGTIVAPATRGDDPATGLWGQALRPTPR